MIPQLTKSYTRIRTVNCAKWKFHYRSLIGQLNYLTLSTRQDIQFATKMHQCSKFSIDPKHSHDSLAAKRIGRYLKCSYCWWRHTCNTRHRKGIRMLRGCQPHWNIYPCGSWRPKLMSQPNRICHHACQLPNPMVFKNAEYYYFVNNRSGVCRTLYSLKRCDLYAPAYQQAEIS